MRSWSIPLCLLLAHSTACVPGGDDDDDSTSGGANNPTIREVILRLYAAQCAFDERCLATNGPRYASRAACEADAPRVYAAADAYFSFEQAYRLGDASKVDACISEPSTHPALAVQPLSRPAATPFNW